MDLQQILPLDDPSDVNATHLSIIRGKAMTQAVVADNWSLQDISTLFSQGLVTTSMDEITFESGQHFYRPLSYAVIQTEALFDLITDLILRDEILVEESYCENDACPIFEAKQAGVVHSYSFLNEADKIAAPRDHIIERICSAESLRKAHEDNINEWIFNRQTRDPLLSATLWGGAGMCARSFLFEKSYTPHPLRKKLFINSGFMFPAADGPDQVTSFFHDDKIRVSKTLYGKDTLYSAHIKIPALPIHVIEEANSPKQMISVALQMRDDYQALRNWLKHFQDAMSTEDTQSLMNHRNELDSITQALHNKFSADNNSPLTMEAGIGIFKIALQDDADNIKNQFGIRSTLNKQTFGNAARQPIKKYLAMFDERDSDVVAEIEEAFV